MGLVSLGRWMYQIVVAVVVTVAMASARLETMRRRYRLEPREEGVGGWVGGGG